MAVYRVDAMKMGRRMRNDRRIDRRWVVVTPCTDPVKVAWKAALALPGFPQTSRDDVGYGITQVA